MMTGFKFLGYCPFKYFLRSSSVCVLRCARIKLLEIDISGIASYRMAYKEYIDVWYKPSRIWLTCCACVPGGVQDEQEDREKQRLIRSLKKQLKQLISQPVFTAQMKTRYPTQMGKLQLPLAPAGTALASLQR